MNFRYLALSTAMLGICGCFMQNASPQARAQDAVTELNDHSRWGRAYAALGNVDTKYQKHFMQRRSAWGQNIQIADVEIKSMQLVNDNEGAESVVDVSWYLLQTMQLQHTVVKQDWKKDGEKFLLTSEKIVQGEETLFATSKSIE